MAYAAGVAVLATVTPVVFTATLTIGSWVPARHQMVLVNQSTFSDVVPAAPTDEDIKPLTKLEPASTRPRSFVTSLFHLLAITDTIMSSGAFPTGSFPADHESRDSDSTCTRNCSRCHRFSTKDTPNPAAASADKKVFCRQRSTMKRTKNGCCRRPTPPNQHSTFSHWLSSVEKPPHTSEASISPGITPPLSSTHNASLLFSVGTLLEMV